MEKLFNFSLIHGNVVKYVVFIISLLVSINVYSQQTQIDFQNTRRSDFTRLLGIQTPFEGIKLNYNNDKAFVEGAFGKALGDSRFLLQAGGTIGTTTNLSNLFKQTLLPTSSLYGSLNYLLPGSTWFFDNTFTSNYPSLQNSSIPIESIPTNFHFRYRESLRENIVAGKHPVNQQLFTFKRLFWVTTTFKYENSKYSFFDANRSFKQQQYDTTYSAYGGRLNINAYWFWNKSDVRWTKLRPNFIFITGYLKFDLVNNIGQLKKVNIIDVSQTIKDSATQTTRYISTSQSNYQGQYREYIAVTPGFELIIAPVRTFAIDIFSEYNMINKSDRDKFSLENYGSYGAGLFFYTSNGNSASKINIGVFYKRIEDSENKWNGEFGIKTTIPITPL